MTSASAASTAAWSPLSLIAGRRFCFGPKPKGLRKAQVQHEVRRAGFGIDGQKFSGPRGIECSELRAVNGTLRGARACGTSGGRHKSRTIIVVDLVSVLIDGRRDVKRRAGTDDHERTQTNQIRKGDTAAQKQSVPNVKGGAAVILGDVVGIRREAGDAGSLSAGVAQGGEAQRWGFGADPYIGVQDELVLFEIAFGNVAVGVASNDRGTR